jgi:Cu(I)/Ag(I) efflux system protein CusF
MAIVKSTVIAAVSFTFLLAGCSKDSGAVAEKPSVDGMATPAQEAVPAPHAADGAAQPARTAMAIGTVKSIDGAAGLITLAHGPVESLGWPGMTMAFKATPKQVAGVKVGQTVSFEFQAQGMNATITKIGPEQ